MFLQRDPSEARPVAWCLVLYIYQPSWGTVSMRVAVQKYAQWSIVFHKVTWPKYLTNYFGLTDGNNLKHLRIDLTTLYNMKTKSLATQRTSPRCGCWTNHIKINPLMPRLKLHSNGLLYSNTVIGIHWPLMGGLLHLAQRGGAWAGCGPAQSLPDCTKCNSPPINDQCTSFVLFDVAL